MNPRTKFFLTVLLASWAVAQVSGQQVRDCALDDHTVYMVPVSGTRVTTVSFPSPITAIDGALITADGKSPGVFQVAHTKGTAYFSTRALVKGAASNVNVRWNNRTFVFELQESPEPIYSLVLRSGRDERGSAFRPLTSNRLLGLLDKAKAFALLRQFHPEEVREIEYRDCRAKPLVSECGSYEVRLIEAFRFPAQDTLVFHLGAYNKSEKAIEHTPERLEIRAGEQVFTPSVADLASTIPAHGMATGYVAVTGTPTGGRNELSLKNDFTFVLARRDPAIDAAAREFDAVQTTGLSK